MIRTQLTGSDGTIVNAPTGLHDTQLNVDCFLTKASDGVQRCLPITVSGIAVGYYADPGCTQEIGMLASCDPPPIYLYKVAGTCGTASYQFYGAGGSVSSANIYYLAGTSCITETPSAGYTYYYLGGAVPPTTFVGFN